METSQTSGSSAQAVPVLSPAQLEESVRREMARNLRRDEPTARPGVTATSRVLSVAEIVDIKNRVRGRLEAVQDIAADYGVAIETVVRIGRAVSFDDRERGRV